MKINSSQLEAFFAVAKGLNFTRAAESLHVTQSALSQRIAKLEDDLATTLFIRERNAIRLTEAGERVLRFCQVNESAESDLLEHLRDTPAELAGSLRIGGFSSVNRSLVIPALKTTMQKNPRLSIQLFTREVHDLAQLLKSAEVDYIITNKKSESPDIENLFLGYEENVLVQAKKSSPTNIYLDHDENDITTKNYLAQNKLNTKSIQMRYLDDVYGLIDGVKNGYGKAVLPLHLIDNEKDLEIIDRGRCLHVPVYLQFYLQPYYRKIHALVLENLTEHFGKKLKSARQRG